LVGNDHKPKNSQKTEIVEFVASVKSADIRLALTLANRTTNAVTKQLI